MKKINHEHSGHRCRLRERVRKEGLANFYDYQVLEYLLSFVIPYKDTNPIAHNLINKFGSFSGVFEADESDLSSVEGMGEVSAHFVSNFRRIYEYYQLTKANQTSSLISPNDVYNYFLNLLKNKMVEELYVVCLSAKGKILATECVATGSKRDATVSIRSIMTKISKTKATSIVIAHNHPNSKPIPSAEDDKFTKALLTSLVINGINLLDHMIIGYDCSLGENNYYSYREQQKIDSYIDEIAYLLESNKINT